GVQFSKLLKRQRELPFGSKLQNHGLNHRMNEEFKRFFPEVGIIPIVRVAETKRYWINEGLLKVGKGRGEVNIGPAVLEIIQGYTTVKKRSFDDFIATCENLTEISGKNNPEIEKFIFSLLAPSVDARLFEIVSYAILKHFYHDQKVYFGFHRDSLEESTLKLFKTGRTNANDGGIDFVMQPLGRFFQVTETLDVKKYFLDFEKVNRYPVSFVIKVETDKEDVKARIARDAERSDQYSDETIALYMNLFEEIFTLKDLRQVAENLPATALDRVKSELSLQFQLEYGLLD